MKFGGTYVLTETPTPRVFLCTPNPVDPLVFLADDGREFTISEPFETDGATTGPLRAIPAFDPWAWPRAAILHDWLWEQRRTGRLRASFGGSNALLYEAIRSLGRGRFVAGACWLGTNLFGWVWWLRGERGVGE